MSVTISTSIFKLDGQCVKSIEWNKEHTQLLISCRRDQRNNVIDPLTGRRGTINRYVTRKVSDLPMMGHPCLIEIELAQVCIDKTMRRMEACAFVEKSCHFTKRLCKLISGMCRYVSISAVARHFRLRWETIKNIDKRYLENTLPSLNPSELTDLEYIGVDEVARAKGHNYMTVVYNMVTGQLIWVSVGRTADVFASFLQQLHPSTAANIKAVAMDMGPAYQKAVRETLPNADIVFDRFHVMQNYGKAIGSQRRLEFKKATQEGKELLKGTRYLILKNADKLNETERDKLKRLIAGNQNMNTLYILKEQLQKLWLAPTYDDMEVELSAWCNLANKTDMSYLKKFAKSLSAHKVGICNYAKHRITSARIEAGNIAIGMIRKRARGITDTEYFKLKIRQLSLPDNESMFYSAA